jgi:hypothetical protein
MNNTTEFGHFANNGGFPLQFLFFLLSTSSMEELIQSAEGKPSFVKIFS